MRSILAVTKPIAVHGSFATRLVQSYVTNNLAKQADTAKVDNLSRVTLLDGLRGWGALLVMVVHIFFDVLPAFDITVLRLHLWWPFSGKFAVAIFFLVSGFALSINYIRNSNNAALIRMGAGRYLRLAIPILAICAIVSILINSGMIPPSNVMPKRFVNLYPFDPTVSHLLKFSLFDVFFNYDSNETYVGPLWTMSFELIGSFIVVALAFTIKWKYYWPLLCTLIGLFLIVNPWYALFIIGSALARCFDTIEQQSNIGGILMMMLGAALSLYLPSNITLVMGSSLFFAGVILCEPATKFFSNSFGRFLGWISFPLYLAHAPVIFAVGMPIYLWANNSPWLMFLAGMCTAAVSVGLAIAMVPVNDLAMALSRAFGKHFETAIAKQFSAFHR